MFLIQIADYCRQSWSNIVEHRVREQYVNNILQECFKLRGTAKFLLAYLWLISRKSICDKRNGDYASSCQILISIQWEVSVVIQKPLDACKCNAHLLITILFLTHKVIFKLFFLFNISLNSFYLLIADVEGYC
jgi:hypothetical protein